MTQAAARRPTARAADGHPRGLVLARFFRPRSLAVSAGSATWASIPACSSSSTTKRHPVQPSTANAASSRPSKRASQSRKCARSAGLEPRPADLAGVGVPVVERDLAAMDVETTYDAHEGLLELPKLFRGKVGQSACQARLPYYRKVPTAEPRGSSLMSSSISGTPNSASSMSASRAGCLTRSRST